jgi:hypothetical protein
MDNYGDGDDYFDLGGSGGLYVSFPVVQSEEFRVIITIANGETPTGVAPGTADTSSAGPEATAASTTPGDNAGTQTASGSPTSSPFLEAAEALKMDFLEGQKSEQSLGQQLVS